jgi:glycosyltransferase involved in cell wall biosynthesis
MLTPPGDVAALAKALAHLIRNPQERARLGAAGARRVRARFTMDAGIDALTERFGLASPAKAAE